MFKVEFKGSKLNRKRKHDITEGQQETDVPRQKFKSNDDEKVQEEKLSKILFGGSSNLLKSLEEAEKEIGSSVVVDSGVGETDDSDDSDPFYMTYRSNQMPIDMKSLKTKRHERLDKKKLKTQSDSELSSDEQMSDSESPPPKRPMLTNNNEEPSAAWFDEDDGIEVGCALDAQGRNLPDAGVTTRSNQYLGLLTQKFTSVSGNPKWAELNKKDDGDSDDEILQTCGFVKQTVRQHLPESTLEFKKLKDLNNETYLEGPYINVIEFHPTSTVGLVAGTSGVASLFAVNGKNNSKLHSMSFPKYPIFSAKFINSGNEIVFGSRHQFIYTYDLLASKAIKTPLPIGLTQFKQFVISPDPKYIAVAGKFGEVHLISTTTKERIALLKQDSDITSLCFNPQGNLLYGHSDVGEVTVWDMNMRRVKHKWIDEGCLQGTKIVVSPSNQFVATGSAQGAVNLYNTQEVLQNKVPKPTKTALNLTTGITDLKFNSTSEMLLFASSDIDTSVKLLHLSSLTVFNNFPLFGTKLGHVINTNFSPGSGYLAVGNRKSTVALYRLKHYKNY